MNPRACVWPLTLHQSPTFQGFWVCLGSLSVADGTHDKKLSGGLHTCGSDPRGLAPGLQEGVVPPQCGGVALREG